MTTSTPSRRERLRTETTAEIKRTARRQLVTGGPAAISLRAIARDMGMTAPAIYRYFDSLDALVLALVTDLFTELRATVDLTAARHAGEPPLTRITHMARAFRHWSLVHPAEFGLIFGSPATTGLAPLATAGSPIVDAGARFGETFFAVLDEYCTEHPADPMPELPSALFQPFLDSFGDRFPLPVVAHFVSAWTRIHGVVAMEVFGQLRWAVTDVEPLFELELARILGQISG